MNDKKKHIPQRTCCGCRIKKPKTDLLRVVKMADNQLQIDLMQNLQGRGAYICFNEACGKLAQKKKGLDRTLKINVPVSFYENVLHYLTEEDGIKRKNRTSRK